MQAAPDSFKREYPFPSLSRMDTVIVAAFAQVMILSVEDVKSLRVMYPDLFI